MEGALLTIELEVLRVQRGHGRLVLRIVLSTRSGPVVPSKEKCKNMRAGEGGRRRREFGGASGGTKEARERAVW